MTPIATVVMPVYNRTTELRRALDSLVKQSMQDYECLVVDDASSMPIETIVAEYDDRFRYLKTKNNVGPAAARIVGFKEMKGEFLFRLDSDNEVFPWALDRAAHFLDLEPNASGVSGLYVFPDGLRVRVGGGSRLLTPVDYARGVRSPVDMVGAVRRSVVEEWLAKDNGYYSAEFHLWFTYHMSHQHLAVDEPWGRYHEGAANQVTKSADERKHLDAQRFVEEHRGPFATASTRPLDQYLGDEWVRLRRARRPEAEAVAEWMGVRGISRTRAVYSRLRGKLPDQRGREYWL
ncbi:glycosyltransferase family A protein [Rhodococcus jostii]|uniref:Glycosyl transferase family 2 n=1 Tax=Rhodococcus jostii TaxID=132919 RepID=A0A1H5HJY8_RHOJO|nr:glycosyltransferase family A protein [Rhodococcus jostii]SEE28303.1 Glycosyl transferase family 2 [Rhodococcus jostii]